MKLYNQYKNRIQSGLSTILSIILILFCSVQTGFSQGQGVQKQALFDQHVDQSQKDTTQKDRERKKETDEFLVRSKDFAEEEIPSVPETYFADKGGDLNKKLQRKAKSDVAGSFSIIVDGELPKKKVQVSINALGVDEEQGENIKVYLNDFLLGRLAGKNKTWTTTVFDAKLEWLLKGENNIRFVIGDSSKKKTTQWTNVIRWGQILSDGGAVNKGEVTEQKTKYTMNKKSVKAVTRTTILAKESGNFQLETAIIDLSGNMIAFSNTSFEMEEGQKIDKDTSLVYSKQARTGAYKIITNLFHQTGKMWVQQQSWEHAFAHFKGTGASDSSPKLVRPIKDIIVMEDEPIYSLNLKGVFSPISKKMAASLLKAKNKRALQSFKNMKIKTRIVSVSNKILLKAEIIDDNLILEFRSNFFGESEIVIEAVAEGKRERDKFKVIVEPVDDPPFPKRYISDLFVKEDANDIIIDLSPVFVDVDGDGSKLPPDPPSGKKVTKSISNNSNLELVATKLTGDQLTVHFIRERSGTATLTVRGTAGEGYTDIDFHISVRPKGGPVIVKPIDDITVNEDAENTVIDLTNNFEKSLDDPRPGKIEILKSLGSNSNDNLVSARVEGEKLILDYVPDAHGKAVVTVLGTARKKSTADIINITVKPVDDSPVVVNKLPDISVPVDSPPTEIDIDKIFADIDNEDQEIKPFVLRNSEPEMVYATIENKKLKLQYKNRIAREAEIKLVGLSNGLPVETGFKLTVNPREYSSYFQFALGYQKVSDYLPAKVVGLTYGLNTNGLIRHTAFELQFSNTLEPNQNRSGVGSTNVINNLEVSTFGLYGVYRLFFAMPIRLAFKLGYLNRTEQHTSEIYNSSASTGIEDETISQGEMSVAFDIEDMNFPNLDFYVSYTRINEQIANLLFGITYNL